VANSSSDDPGERSESNPSAVGASEQNTREQILRYIKEHPGTHLRQIRRELNLAMGMTQYHLYALERERKIVSGRAGFYKRFYPNLVFGDSQHDILDVLSQETERDLLMFLLQSPECTQKELAAYARLSPSTINWHMKRMGEVGLVETKKEGQFVRYRVKADAEEVLKLLKGYHPAVWETWADRLADVVGDVSSSSEEVPEEGNKDD
jgi:predicted transcriptional regulator